MIMKRITGMKDSQFREIDNKLKGTYLILIQIHLIDRT